MLNQKPNTHRPAFGTKQANTQNAVSSKYTPIISP